MRRVNEWEASSGMIIYRTLSFFLNCLCGLLFGASIGLVLGVLIAGSAESFFWLFSWGETVLMTIGAVVGSGLGIALALVVDAELRQL
ncbi:hypothetical protein EPA93_45125 [Ktedonosporobacter rubrisoli]|uniref:Uncharacterized protein n=1 Tax=Ktedonosporobacter rubrisoli TaxID=2509675 RepID=A0A4P6K3J9_KTERU|nr:hypothetical protein [Ktedonosporobacter rubrisoli]QBD82769.1 hypothetical protein EPA93_45125 [Ktedonosporobacter rubrisoli]